ncbi:MAG: hypothetical protein IPN44_12690 [Flavobacteriales bacterium]|nr:hypothetical protein [Flavobacteriales bacterium]
MSSTVVPRARKPILRILGAVGIALVVGIGWFCWWASRHGEDWLDRTAEERIHAAIAEASVPGYRFTLASLKSDARHGRLLVTGAELKFEPQLLDSLRSGAYQYLFAAKVDTVELRGVSFWGLLLRGDINVEAIVLAGPEFHYFTGPKRVALADPFKRLGHGGKSAVSVLTADTLRVRHAGATVQDLGENLPELDVNGLALDVSALRISALGQHAGVHLVVAGADLHVDSISTQLPDGSRLRIGAIALSREQRKGLITRLSIVPPLPDSMDTSRMRKSVLTLTVDSITLSGLDLDRSLTDEALRITHMGIHGANVAVELDKTLPEPAPTPVQLPPAALASMPFSIRLDTLELNDATVIYRERDPRTKRWGVIPFDHLRGIFTNVTNDAEAIAGGERIQGEFACTFFDSAQVSGHYDASLDGSERFTISTNLSGLSLPEVNSATGPLLRMQVESGELHNMEMRIEGNAKRAKGKMTMDYSGLLVRVEPGTPKELRHSMFGNVMDAMLSQAYGGALSANREQTFSIDRDPDRSMLTYLWHATREGLARNLVPEAKERMRTMLKTDAEKWRSERAERKAKRGAVK